MVCRRWCRVWTVMLAVGAMPAILALAAAAPVAVSTAKDFETAAAKDMPGMRELIIKKHLSIIKSVDRDANGTAVSTDFTASGLGVNSARPEVRLNAAILIHDLGTLSTDSFLIQMLQNKDAAVRYWAARGLADISKGLVSSGAGKVIKALGDQAKIETSGVVAQELIKALIQYQAFGPLLDSLGALTNQMEAAIPDVATLQTATLGLDFVSRSMAGSLADDKSKAVTIAARTASFAAQQQVKNEEALKVIDGAATLPTEYSSAVRKVIDAAMRVYNGAASAPKPAPTGNSAGELLLNVNLLFGKDMPADAILKNIAVPPKVKTAP